ncbi:MAG: hypothetical protein L6R35_004007 [Caloplaca aegaea]|nr:MAG: hypothetical protein L6R35_004007 [Caloplaca aegaea]
MEAASKQTTPSARSLARRRSFLARSGIVFVTVVQSQSYVVEDQDDETTKQEVLAVLRDVFSAENVPEPIAFMYPRWSLEP